jgi:hypothetical protein
MQGRSDSRSLNTFTDPHAARDLEGEVECEHSDEEHASLVSELAGDAVAMPRRLTAVSGSVLALAICAVAYVVLVPVMDVVNLKAGGHGMHGNVRSLLDGPEITDVATKNIMKLSKDQIPAADEGVLKQAVSKHLSDLTNQIKEQHPEAFRQLESISVTKEQKDAHLKLASNMADHRAQQIGLEAAQTVYNARNQGPEGIKKSLSEKFGPYAVQLRALRDELIPEPLRGDEAGKQSGVSFNPERMDLFKAIAVSDKGDEVSSRRLAFDTMQMAAAVVTMFDLFIQQVNTILASYNVPALPLNAMKMVQVFTAIGACLTTQSSAAPDGSRPLSGDGYHVNMVKCAVKYFGHFVDVAHALQTSAP